MGRASRWLRGLWSGSKKDNKENKELHPNANLNKEEKKDKKRWSFGKSAKDSGDVVLGQNVATAATVEAAWYRSFYNDSEKEQSKHAIAVAAATAAAADAAVAAAHAAAEVVRLTSQGRGGMFVVVNVHEKIAAMKIQTAFRGHLARKALRALRALVKLQALVRGFLVRKQAAKTFHSMQALIRAQSSVRAQRSKIHAPNDRRIQAEVRPHRSSERFDEARSDQLLSISSRRFSASIENTSSSFERSPKIVEIDTVRPKSRSSRRTSSPSIVDSGEELHSNSLPSPLPTQIPTRLTIPDTLNVDEYDWCLVGEKCKVSVTAQSTPRYMNSCYNVLLTPAKSVCGTATNGPNYMSNTQSFVSKVRSQSAPKQRPEPARMRKRMALSEVMLESRASVSGVAMQRSSCTQMQEPFNFKSAVVSRIDRSAQLLGKEIERDFYLDSKW